jgi:hypothetical protein
VTRSDNREDLGRWQAAAAKQSAIGAPKPRPPGLAAQNLEFMAKHKQLDLLQVRATATTDKQAEQSPNSEVQKREEHPAILAAAPSQRPRHE